jgi:hypothetical protein
MRKRRWFSALIFVIPAVLAVATIAVAGDGGKRNFKAEALNGYQEIPALSTPAAGTFEASLNGAGDEISYTLTYSGLEAPVTQAHVHFGQRGVSGGVSFYLCTNVGGPAGTQPCPPSPATVSGTITAADVVGPAAQGIAPAEFDEIVRAIRAGVAYANVHSTKYPVGEIRAQINDRNQRGDNGDD